jgi:hypothetical protein
MESLYVSKNLKLLVAPALEELTREHATAVFPKLHTLFMEDLQPYGFGREAMDPFGTARWLSDRPVAIHQRLAPESDPKITLSPYSWLAG